MRTLAASYRWILGLGIAGAALLTGQALAQGAQTPPSAPVTVVNRSSNPVPVTATSPLPVAGSIAVTGPVAAKQSGVWTVTAEETFAPGRQPARFGPVDGAFTGSFVGRELIPPVPAGQTFIVSHLNAIGFSNNDAFPLTEGSCTVQLRVVDTYQAFLLMEMHQSGSAVTGSQPAFLPLNAGEGLYVICGGKAADGTRPSQGFNVTAGGYFVPVKAPV